MNKRIFLTLTAAVGLTMTAHANIGDTTHKSDLRYGTHTFAKDGEYYYRNYGKGNYCISTLFNDKGLCVYIQYSHQDGSDFSPKELTMLLNDNVVDSNHPWSEYRHNSWWDGLDFFGMYLYQDQQFVSDGRTRTVPTLRITNRATLTAMGLMERRQNVTTTTEDVNSI